MLASVDDLDLLRHEFNAEDGSFLVQLPRLHKTTA
jgi:hypothetical protein